MPGTHAHSRATGPEQSPTGRKGWSIGIALIAVALVGVGVAVFTTNGPSGPAVASPTSTTTNAVMAAANSGPLSVVSVSPADATTEIPTDATVSVQFSVPISAQSPPPSLTPAVAGTWQVVTPTTFTFVASAPFVPLTTETATPPTVAL